MGARSQCIVEYFFFFQELLVHSTLKLETSANDDGVALFLSPDFSFSIDVFLSLRLFIEFPLKFVFLFSHGTNAESTD